MFLVKGTAIFITRLTILPNKAPGYTPDWIILDT